MSWQKRLRYRIGALFLKGRLEQEMADEMREHLEERTERYIQSGMSPGEAQLSAMREFGGIDQLKERCREQRGWTWLEQLAKDFYFAIRSLAKAPGFSLTIVCTLALGIGSAAAIFHAADWAIFQANVFPADLYLLGMTDRLGHFSDTCTDAQVRAYREQSNVFREYGLSAWQQFNISIAGSPVATRCLDISPNVFPMLGIEPGLGRGFLAGEDVAGRNQEAVISYGFWQTHFAGLPDVLGQKIEVGKTVCTIVGVLKKNQSLPSFFWAEVYRPLTYTIKPATPGSLFLYVFLRLQPGVTRATAEAAVAGAKVDWPAHLDPSAPEQRPTLTSLPELQKLNHPEIYWILCGAVGFLYGIACLNATNLMLVRQLGRKRELSVRLALGGGRWSIIRLLLFESISLSSVSSAAGLFVANWLGVLFAALSQDKLQLNWLSSSSLVEIDLRTFVVLAAVTVLTSVAIVVVPAIGLWRLDVQTGLKDGGGGIGESRRLARLRGGLVVMQVAFAIILLTGAGLMVRTFRKMQDVRLGFETEHRVKVLLSFPDGHVTGNEARLALLQTLQDHLRHLPGVVDVAFGSDNLMAGYYSPYLPMQLTDGTPVKVMVDTFSSNYREVAGVVLKRGQWFDETSRSEIMINEAFARRFFGDKDPVGQPVRPVGAPKQWKGWTVSGVIADMKETIRGAQGYHLFLPPTWAAESVSSLILRFTNDPEKSFEATIRRAICQLDPEIVAMDLRPLAETRYRDMYLERFALSVLEVLSVIALFLTIVGLFSVLAYSVDRRMNEFGVRLALGAQPGDLHQLIMKRGVMAAASGIVLGIVGALALTRFMQSLLFETASYDPPVYAAVALLLLAAAVAACWLPARRATQVDITRLLRAE